MRSSSYAQPKAKKWEPASPGLASNGKHLRIRLLKCPNDSSSFGGISGKHNKAALRGFSVETRKKRADNDLKNNELRSLPPL